MGRRSLITGVTGQDGAYLAKHLLEKGHEVIGLFRRNSNSTFWRLEELKILERITLVEYQIGDNQGISTILSEQEIDEIYHLAGESYTQDSFKQPKYVLNTNINGVVDLLEACKITATHANIFIANSSEIFTSNQQNKSILTVTEDSPKNPLNPYGISHLTNFHLVNLYRSIIPNKINLGIMFNHESPLRSKPFISKKISEGIARLLKNSGEPIQLGNLNSTRDWGSAVEFVKAMSILNNSSQSSNFILATGQARQVRDLLQMFSIAAGYQPIFVGEGLEEKCVCNLTGKVIAEINPKYFRKIELGGISGNISKISNAINWKHSKPIEELIAEMLEYDLSKI